jgi:hypothetical protein
MTKKPTKKPRPAAPQFGLSVKWRGYVRHDPASLPVATARGPDCGQTHTLTPIFQETGKSFVCADRFWG